MRFKDKRAITFEEHDQIISAEKNSERKLFYRLLWEIGSGQSDAATLTAEQIDWKTRTLSYRRKKTGEWTHIIIGKSLERILNQLSQRGPLFPIISQKTENDRAAEFYRRCKLLGIRGVSLHSYRYPWAERAQTAGYPERFAQAARGHASKAVHRTYARKALVKIPSLEDYEKSLSLKSLTRDLRGDGPMVH